MKNKILLLFVLIFISFPAFSQCNKLIPINDSTVSIITSPYQISFLSQNPVTKLDSIVYEILNLDDIVSPQTIKSLVMQIGQLQTPNAYALLYTCCCRPIFISDLNAFNSFTSTISYYGGYEALNTYFLGGKIQNTVNSLDFANKVVIECYKNDPLAFYCAVELPIEYTENTVINGIYTKHDTIIDNREFHWQYKYPLSSFVSAFGEEYYEGRRDGYWLNFGGNSNTYNSTLYHYDNDTVMGRAIEWNNVNYPNIIEFKGLLIYGVRVGEWDYYEYKANKSRQKQKIASITYDNNGNVIERSFFSDNGKLSSKYFYNEYGKTIWYSSFNEKGEIILDVKGGAPDVLQVEIKR